jgi:hypothetical protein
MKLLLVASMLAGFAGLAGTAHADTYYGPPGGAPDMTAPPPVQQDYQPVAQHRRQGNQGPNQGPRGQGEMKRALVERFDRNHDGRLEPRERAQAARALRRMANRMDRQAARAQMRAERQQMRAQRQQQRQGQGQRQGGPNVDVYVD